MAGAAQEPVFPALAVFGPYLSNRNLSLGALLAHVRSRPRGVAEQHWYRPIVEASR